MSHLDLNSVACFRIVLLASVPVTAGVLCREYDEVLKDCPRDMVPEKLDPALEEEILWDLNRAQKLHER